MHKALAYYLDEFGPFPSHSVIVPFASDRPPVSLPFDLIIVFGQRTVQFLLVTRLGKPEHAGPINSSTGSVRTPDLGILAKADAEMTSRCVLQAQLALAKAREGKRGCGFDNKQGEFGLLAGSPSLHLAVATLRLSEQYGYLRCLGLEAEDDAGRRLRCMRPSICVQAGQIEIGRLVYVAAVFPRNEMCLVKA